MLNKRIIQIKNRIIQHISFRTTILLLAILCLNLDCVAQERKSVLEFNGTDVNGKSISILDFKGKVVYLDIWATWCLPCRVLFPKSQKLEELYHSEDIVFLYVSVDHDYQRWESFINRKERQGIQLIGSADFVDVIMPNYNIIGIPRFMLIDKTGKVFSSDASRPGWPELIDEINLLLAE